MIGIAGVREKLLPVAPLLLIGALVAVPVAGDGPTVCPWALCTGTACPGCGLTRAAANLLRGDMATAMTYHPLVPLIAAQALLAWGYVMGRRLGVVPALGQRTIQILLAGTAVLLVAVWVIRLTTGTLPPVGVSGLL